MISEGLPTIVNEREVEAAGLWLFSALETAPILPFGKEATGLCVPEEQFDKRETATNTGHRRVQSGACCKPRYSF